MRGPRLAQGAPGADCRRAAAVLASINDAEAVTFGVGEDHVVSVRRTVRLNGPGRPQTEQTLYIAGLIVGIEIEVNPRSFLRPGGPHAQRQVRTGARARPQGRPIVIGRPTQLVIKRLGPERELLLKVIHTQDHGADAHQVTVAPAAPVSRTGRPVCRAGFASRDGSLRRRTEGLGDAATAFAPVARGEVQGALPPWGHSPHPIFTFPNCSSCVGIRPARRRTGRAA